MPHVWINRGGPSVFACIAAQLLRRALTVDAEEMENSPIWMQNRYALMASRLATHCRFQRFIFPKSRKRWIGPEAYKMTQPRRDISGKLLERTFEHN